MKRAVLFVLALGLGLAANAQVLYKLVDKNGKVTYAEKIPPGFDGQATRVDVDPKRNTATLPKPQAANTEGSSKNALAPSARQQAEARRQERIENAKKQLEEAKAELASALESPSDTDVVRMGNAGGGSRPVWSDDYKARIANLETRVKDAEKALSDAYAY
jgi:hypothetical protein